MSWDPALYLTFADHRTRPAAELLARVPAAAPRRVVDLGCGPANSTTLLALRWPEARLEGVDNSEAMLAEARSGGVAAEWTCADIAAWSPDARFDVIFSNATLHWLPDQAVLLSRLMGLVAPRGTFAFQVPNNFHAPSHVLMREVAAGGRWADRLRDVRNVVPGSAALYFDILEPHTAALDIWETEYLQILEDEDAVYRWVSGTGLRPFLDALEGADREDFIATYKARLNQAYPRRADGRTLFPFRRLFVVATTKR